MKSMIENGSFCKLEIKRPLYLFILLIFALFYSCSTPENHQLFFQTTVADYSVIVSGKGELQAKSAHVLQTPMVWPAPTLSYLVP